MKNELTGHLSRRLQPPADRRMRCRRSWKRGSARRGSSRGSTPTEGIQSERLRTALLSQAKACSLSPNTEYAPAMLNPQT